MSPPLGITSQIVVLMRIRGHTPAEIQGHLQVSRARVYQILKKHSDDARSGYGDMPDDPRWFMARARIGRAESREEMSQIWGEYRDVWTQELTDYGRAVLDIPRKEAWRKHIESTQNRRTHYYEDLLILHEQGRLVHAWTTDGAR